jgi:hypothetical protein
MGGIIQSGARANPRLDLGVALMEFIDTQDSFIGTKVCPVFKTQVKEGTYSAITRETLVQTGTTRRSTKGNYNRGTFGTKDKTFACKENGWEQPLGDDERNLYASDFDAEFSATKVAEGVVLRGQEARVADLIFNTTTFTGASLYTDNSGTPWTTAATDARAQIVAARGKVRANCGMLPNALIMNYTNFERLKSNTGIIAAIQYTSRAVDAEIGNAIADYFGVKYLFVAKAIKNSAKEGQAFAGADIWSNLYAMLAVVAENPNDLSQPAIGRTFLWAKDCPENVYVESYRDESVRGDVFRVRQHTDEELIDANFGHLMKVATS